MNRAELILEQVETRDFLKELQKKIEADFEKAKKAKKVEDRAGIDVVARMGLLPKSVPKPSGVITEKDKNRQGKCYEFAGRFILNNVDWTLIHGTIFPPLGNFEDTDYLHAWTEKGNLVYDGVFDKFYKKKDYYTAYLPKNLKKYNIEQMRKKVLKSKHWGSW